MQSILERLGFVRYRDVPAEIGRRLHATVGVPLPDAYREFLCWREPSRMPILYHFDQDGETIDGCVSEFHNVAPRSDELAELANQVVVSARQQWLPVACDPGGNWLCLRLESGTVCDLDNASGRWSQIATDVNVFVSLLRLEDA